MNNQPKTILLDCDVVSHFITNNCLSDLFIILAPHKCVMLDYVYNEATKQSFRKSIIDSLITKGDLTLMEFPHADFSIKQEFARIKKLNYLIGDGERACMAVARHTKDVIASSNFRDIAPYCTANNIYYLGTLDILLLAVSKDIYDESTCDIFIQQAIKNNKARFPKGVTQIRYYIPNDFSYL